MMRTIWMLAAVLSAAPMASCATSDGSTMAAADAGLAAAATSRAPNFAAEAARADMYEIQAGQLAQSRGSSSHVRQLGQMLRDHTMTSEKLMAALRAAGTPMSPPPLDARRQGMLADLQKASDPTFDRLFLEQQAVAHKEALALHRGYAANGDVPALKAVASEASGVVAQHLTHLQENAAR